MESPVSGAGVARREFAVSRDEGACVDQQVVVFTDGEVGSRVDGDGVRYMVDSDQSTVGGNDDVWRSGVIVHQGDVFTGDGLHVLVKAEHQVGPAGDGPGGLAGDAQWRGVKAQIKGGAGRVALQVHGVFYNGLQAEGSGAGAQAGGGEAPGARAGQGGLAQTGATDGVIHGDALTGLDGAAVGAAQAGRGVVAGGAGAQCAGGVAKVVCDAGDDGAGLGHIGHGLERGQGVDGAAVVGCAHQGVNNARKVGVGHASDAQQLQLRLGHQCGGASCGVQRRGLHDGVHRIGVCLQPSGGADRGTSGDVQCIAQQADFGGGLYVAYTDSDVLLFAGGRGVVVNTIGAVQDGGVGVDQELDFSRGVDAVANDGKAGQGAVDAVQVAAHAAADAGDAGVQVVLNAGGRAGVEVGVAADKADATDDDVGDGLQLGEAVGVSAVVVFGGNGAHDGVQVVGRDALHADVQEVGSGQARGGGQVGSDILDEVGDAGQLFNLGDGVDVAGKFASDGVVEQGQVFCIGAGSANACTNGGVVSGQRIAAWGGVSRDAVGFGNDFVVGIDQGLHFGAGAHAGVHDVSAGQCAVDGGQVASEAAVHTGHTKVKVSLCAGGGAVVGQCVGGDQRQCRARSAHCCVDYSLQISQGADACALVVGVVDGRNDRRQVVVGNTQDAHGVELGLGERCTASRCGHHGLHCVGQGLQFGDAVDVCGCLGIEHVAQQALFF